MTGRKCHAYHQTVIEKALHIRQRSIDGFLRLRDDIEHLLVGQERKNNPDTGWDGERKEKKNMQWRGWIYYVPKIIWQPKHTTGWITCFLGVTKAFTSKSKHFCHWLARSKHSKLLACTKLNYMLQVVCTFCIHYVGKNLFVSWQQRMLNKKLTLEIHVLWHRATVL